MVQWDEKQGSQIKEIFCPLERELFKYSPKPLLIITQKAICSKSVFMCVTGAKQMFPKITKSF